MSQFKETVRNLSSSIAGAAKQTLANYKPSRLFDPNQAFNRIAEQGIANLSYRSPVLADIAQTMLQSVQVEMERKQQQSDTIRSKSADGFRDAVAQKLGIDTKSSKVEAEMRRIIEKIDKSVDKAGVEETRKTSFFREYEKHFDTMKVAQKREASAQNSNSTETSESNDPTFDGAVLNRIENNTQRTFNALEALASKLALSGGGAGGNGGAGGMGASSFIDPMTGMPSISAAVGSLGGSFLSKIFTDETMEKFAKKAKHFFNIDSDEESTSETKVNPAPNAPASDVSDAVEETNKATVTPTVQETTTPIKAAPNGSVADVSDAVAPVKAAPNGSVADVVTAAEANNKAAVKSTPNGSVATNKAAVAPAKSTPNGSVTTNKEIVSPVKAAPIKTNRPTSTGINKKSILDVLGGLNLDLNKSHTDAPVFPTLIPMSSSGKAPESKSSEDTTEAAIVVKKTSEKTVGVLTDILDELKKLNKNTESENKNSTGETGGTGASSIMDGIKERIGDKIVDGVKRRYGGRAKKYGGRVMDGIKKRLPGVSGALGNLGGKTKGILGRGAGMASKGVGAALQVGSRAASYAPAALNAAKGVAGTVVGGAARVALPALAAAGGALATAGTAAMAGLAGAGSALSAAAAAALPAVGAAGAAALPALAVGAAGATGALVGNKVVNPLINKGITAITGKENTLGTYVHSLLNKDPDVSAPVSKEKIDAFRAEKASKLPVAAKSASVTAIHAVTDKKDKRDQAEKAKSQAPIIINQNGGGGNNNNSASTQNSAAPIILGGKSVRNNDSTFERVQMQDFWPRTA